MSSITSSAFPSGTSDKTSTRAKPKFNRHGYGSLLSINTPGTSATGTSSAAGSDKKKAARKWAKGDNRKKFDVLPKFE